MNARAELLSVLERIGTRFQRHRLLNGLTVCWSAFAALGLLTLVLPGVSESNSTLKIALILGGLAGAIGTVWILVSRYASRDPLRVARRIETTHPDLSALLLAAVEQQPAADGRLGYLQTAVVQKALDHSRTHDWNAAPPPKRLLTARILHGLSVAAMIAIFALLVSRSPHSLTSEISSFVSNDSAGIAVEVLPGHTELERGTPLLVTARFPGLVPADAYLIAEGVTPPVAPRPMSRNLDDPTFAGYVPAVDADLSYRVEFDGGRSETFRVTVFEHPELRRANANLAFPSYTGMDSKRIDDVRHVTAVEGTRATLEFLISKPVVKAVLIDEKKREMPLSLLDAEKQVYSTTLTLTESQRFKVQLVDAKGRANKLPADVSVNVLKNLPPVVTVPRPGRDTRVSPLEELPVKADMKDDFGLVRYGLSVTAAGLPAKEIVLNESEPKQTAKRAQPGHLLDFEGFNAQPDQVVSYYFWAEDIGPDGQRRRTSGDMYFAEPNLCRSGTDSRVEVAVMTV